MDDVSGNRNPQNDLQAMARCHRIGQTKEVKVYRLVTKATYEQSLFETSAKKYGLDEAVLGGGDAPMVGGGGGGGGGGAKEDAKKINDLLKFGVHGALRDASGEEAKAFAEEDIDQILSGRAEHRAIGSRVGNTFSVATFSVGAETGAEGENVDAEKFWEEALPDAVKAAREDAANADPFDIDERFRVEGPRKRYKAGEYRENATNGMGGAAGGQRRRRGGDEDFDAEGEDGNAADGSGRGKSGGAGGKKEGRAATVAEKRAEEAGPFVPFTRVFFPTRGFHLKVKHVLFFGFLFLFSCW